jgi:peptidoglycan hydrolase CwlO-like protein
LREYEKIETPTAFPSMCVCGSQKAPLVDTGLLKDRYGHIYLCRMCVTRSARALGIIKGAEHERLEHAADELAQAEKEISERQGIIDRTATTLGQAEGKIVTLQAYIETLQGDLALHKASWEQVFGTAKERVSAT